MSFSDTSGILWHQFLSSFQAGRQIFASLKDIFERKLKVWKKVGKRKYICLQKLWQVWVWYFTHKLKLRKMRHFMTFNHAIKLNLQKKWLTCFAYSSKLTEGLTKLVFISELFQFYLLIIFVFDGSLAEQLVSFAQFVFGL